MTDEEKATVCGCEIATFLKVLNFLCGGAMVIFGFFNIFGFLSAGSQVVLEFGFFFY